MVIELAWPSCIYLFRGITNCVPSMLCQSFAVALMMVLKTVIFTVGFFVRPSSCNAVCSTELESQGLFQSPLYCCLDMMKDNVPCRMSIWWNSISEIKKCNIELIEERSVLFCTLKLRGSICMFACFRLVLAHCDFTGLLLSYIVSKHSVLHPAITWVNDHLLPATVGPKTCNS